MNHSKIAHNIVSVLLFVMMLPLEIPSYSFGGLSPEADSQMINDLFGSMSPEDVDALIQELEAIDPRELEALSREIDEFVEGLDPNERDAFYKQAEQFEQEFASRRPPFGNTYPQPVAEPKKPEETIEQKKEREATEQKAEKLAKMAERIAQSLQTLLLTTGSMLDFQTDIQEWAEDQEIQPWRPGLTWEVFKLQLEQLMKDLLKVSMFNASLNKYAYMELATEDQALESALKNLDEALANSIPKLSKAKESSSEKTTLLKKAISSTAQAILGQQLDTKVAQIIEKFAPETEKIKAQQKEMEQKARQQIQTPAFPRPTTIVGQPFLEEPKIITPDYSPGTSTPSKAPTAKKPKAPSLIKDKDTKGGSQGKGGVKAGSGSGGKKDSKPKEKKEDEKKKEEEKKEKDLKDSNADSLLGGIITPLTQIPGQIAVLEGGKKYGETLTLPAPDATTGNITIPADLVQKLTEIKNATQLFTARYPQALTVALAQFEARFKALSADQKKYYAQKIEDQRKPFSEEFSKFAKAVNNFIKKPIRAENAAMQYTFFGREVPDTLLSQAAKTALAPYKSNIAEAIKKIKSIDKKLEKLSQ